MARYEWQPQLEVGNPTVDSQHRMLIDAANLLHEALQSGMGEATAKPIFDVLLHYTEQHFRDEEQFMVAEGASILEAHRREHQALTQELRDLWNENRLGYFAGLGPALKDWVEARLVPHMMTVDQESFRDFRK